MLSNINSNYLWWFPPRQCFFYSSRCAFDTPTTICRWGEEQRQSREWWMLGICSIVLLTVFQLVARRRRLFGMIEDENCCCGSGERWFFLWAWKGIEFCCCWIWVGRWIASRKAELWIWVELPQAGLLSCEHFKCLADSQNVTQHSHQSHSPLSSTSNLIFLMALATKWA